MPDPFDPNAYLDSLGVKNTSGGTTTTATGPGQKPPAGFTQAVPGSNNTAWFNPQSGYVWSPSSTDPAGFTAHVSKIEADRIMGEGWSDKQKTDSTTTSSTTAQKPPAGFTTPVPGSNGTTFFNPTSGYVWSPSSSNPAGFTAHVAKDEADRIMGAGWSDQQKSSTTTPPPALPDAYKQMGFVQVGTNAFAPSVQHGYGAKATTGPATVYYDAKTNLWSASPIPISPEQFNLGMAQAKGGQTSPTQTSPTVGSTSLVGSQPTTGMPAPAPPVPAQTQMLDTGGKYPQQFIAPASLNPQTGYSGPGQTYQAHTLQAYYPPPGTMPVANGASSMSPAAPPAGLQPKPPEGYGPIQDAQTWKGPTPPAGYGPVQDASTYKPESAQSSGPVVVNGVTFAPDVADAIKGAWPQELWPQAFAIAARESGGNPTVNNGPTGTGGTGKDKDGNPYPGGYMNNAPQYGNAPGSLGYNTVDGGLFGINSIHGLTPEQTIDPKANAAKAYELYQSSLGSKLGGWGPWSGNGTIPLPPAAAPESLGTLKRIGDTVQRGAQSAIQAGQNTGQVPGLGGQGSPGQIAPDLGPPIYTTGQQTGNIGTRTSDPNDRVTGLNGATGFNAVQILKGAGIPSTGSPDKDMVIAAGIVQKQQSTPMDAGANGPTRLGDSTFYQGAKSGGLEWQTRMDSGMDFSPGKVNGGPMRNSPMGADAPVTLASGVVVPHSTDASPAQQAYNAQVAGLAPIGPTSNVGAVYNASRNPGAEYANNANLPSPQELAAIAQAQAEKDKEAALGGADGPVRGFAAGGTVSVDPYKVASTPPATSPSPIPNPGMITGPVQNPQQQTPRMPQVPGTGSPILDTTGSTTTPNFDPTDPHLLDPFQEAANQLAQQQHMRQNTNYINQRAGLGAAQGIAVQPGQHPTAPLGANQFYDYAPAVQDSMNQISGLQNEITGYGGLVDPSGLLAQQNQLTADQARYQRALDLQNKIQGYGPQGDAGAMEAQRNALLQQLAPLQQIQQYQQELAALGNQRDPATILSEKSSIEGSIKMIQDSIAQAQAGGPPSQFSGNEIAGLQAQLASLNNEASQAQSAANRKAELSNLLGSNTGSVDDQIGQLNAQKAQLEQTIQNSQSSAAARQEAQNQLNGLINPGEDINAGLAGVQAKLAPLGQQIANANKSQAASTTLQNLIGKGVPGFADGGNVSVSDPYAAAGGAKSMVTPEPIAMIGQQTGQTYGQMGEAGPEFASDNGKGGMSITPMGGPPPSAFRQMAGTGDADIASMLARVQMQAQTGVPPHPAILQHISTLIPQMKDANAQNQAANILAGITASLPRQQPGPVGSPLFQDPLAMFAASKFGDPKAPVAA